MRAAGQGDGLYFAGILGNGGGHNALATDWVSA